MTVYWPVLDLYSRVLEIIVIIINIFILNQLSSITRIKTLEVLCISLDLRRFCLIWIEDGPPKFVKDFFSGYKILCLFFRATGDCFSSIHLIDLRLTNYLLWLIMFGTISNHWWDSKSYGFLGGQRPHTKC